MGAMNSAVLVSQFLQTQSWEDAIEKLELFWTNKEEGLASTLSEQDINKLPGWTEWQKASKQDSQDAASAEAARRYYSVKYFISNGASRVHEPLQSRPDSKFFDEKGNIWFLIHSNDPLKQTILKFAKFPIATIELYWLCQQRNSAFSTKLKKLIKERERYRQLVNQERTKP